LQLFPVIRKDVFILFEFNIELTSVDRDNSAVSACLGSK
jgi:hypothetical protein